MATLKERLLHRMAHIEGSDPSDTDRIADFFHQELLALADFLDEAEKNKSLFTAGEIIRAKANELI